MIEFLRRLTRLQWPEVWHKLYWRGLIRTVLVTYVVCGLLAIVALLPVFLRASEEFGVALNWMIWVQLVTIALVGWPMGIALSWLAVVAIVLLVKWMGR